MSSAINKESLLSFPCRFPVKAMGKAGEGFDLLVMEIVRRHAEDLDETLVPPGLTLGD